MPKKFRCKECGKTFEMFPCGHGDFLLQGAAPAESVPCDGVIEAIDPCDNCNTRNTCKEPCGKYDMYLETCKVVEK